LVERRSPKPDVAGSNPAWPAYPISVCKEPGLKKIIEFLKESRLELKKVNWPSREEVLTSTRVVIISILVIAAVIALMDYVIKTIIFTIIGG
jgi:preprotein translocase subunit SecE